jgi:Kef-type K+ transport system membrane component KefB
MMGVSMAAASHLLQQAQNLLHEQALLLLGLVTLVAFYFGRFARRVNLPSLIGFMVLGVVLGPSMLGLFQADHEGMIGNLSQFSFITEIALGLVAFTIGAELSMRSLRQMGSGVISIILMESFGAFFVVMGIVYALTRSWPLALLFGAVAPASAPAGTVAVIQEYRARGPLTKVLYAVVGFDDGLAILIFGFAAALAKVLLLASLNVTEGSGTFLAAMKPPAIEIVGSLIVGTVLGFIFCQLVRRLQHPRDMLIMVFGTVLTATGIALHFHLSLILTNMVIGFVLVNTRHRTLVQKVSAPLQEVMPLVFVLFFCMAGAHLDIGELPKLGVVGIAYVFARTAGLIGGSRLGASLGKADETIKKYVGLGILSQAGVAIGLSLIIQKEFRELANRPEVAASIEKMGVTAQILYDPIAMGAVLITTITATCIVFEIIGPILTKYALTKAGEINPAEDPADK